MLSVLVVVPPVMTLLFAAAVGVTRIPPEVIVRVLLLAIVKVVPEVWLKRRLLTAPVAQAELLLAWKSTLKSGASALPVPATDAV